MRLLIGLVLLSLCACKTTEKSSAVTKESKKTDLIKTRSDSIKMQSDWFMSKSKNTTVIVLEDKSSITITPEGNISASGNISSITTIKESNDESLSKKEDAYSNSQSALQLTENSKSSTKKSIIKTPMWIPNLVILLLLTGLILLLRFLKK